MAAHAEALFISAVLRTGDYNTPSHGGINNQHFHLYREEWRWVEKFIARYRKTPSVAAFRHKFPDFPMKKVNDVAHFTDEVRRCHARFLFNNALNESIDMLEQDDVSGAVRHAHTQLINIQSALQGESGDFSLVDDVDLLYQDVKRRVDKVSDRGQAGIPTGFPTLDKLTGGPQDGDYWVVAARFGQGKTWTLNAMTVNAITEGHSAAYFSLEQTKNAIAFRLLNLLSSRYGKTIFPASALRKGRGFNLMEFRSFLESLDAQGFGACHIFDASRGRITPLTIAATIERVNPEVVFVDYLTLMDNRDKDWQAVARMSGEMQQLAKRYEVPIVVAAQISRLGEGREPPKAGHLAGSDAIGQDADAVITLAKQSQSVMKYRLAKMREDEDQAMWYAEFNPSRGRYGEVSGDHAEEIVEQEREED